MGQTFSNREKEFVENPHKIFGGLNCQKCIALTLPEHIAQCKKCLSLECRKCYDSHVCNLKEWKRQEDGNRDLSGEQNVVETVRKNERSKKCGGEKHGELPPKVDQSTAREDNNIINDNDLRDEGEDDFFGQLITQINEKGEICEKDQETKMDETVQEEDTSQKNVKDADAEISIQQNSDQIVQKNVRSIGAGTVDTNEGEDGNLSQTSSSPPKNVSKSAEKRDTSDSSMTKKIIFDIWDNENNRPLEIPPEPVRSPGKNQTPDDEKSQLDVLRGQNDVQNTRKFCHVPLLRPIDFVPTDNFLPLYDKRTAGGAAFSSGIFLWRLGEGGEAPWFGKCYYYGTEVEADIKLMEACSCKEKIAYDIFEFYGVLVPKSCLSRQPLQNVYIVFRRRKENVEKKKKFPLHIMTMKVDGYRDYSDQNLLKGRKDTNEDGLFEVTFHDFVVTAEGKKFQTEGFGRALAVMLFLDDADGVGNGDNIGYVVEDSVARICKIDPGCSFEAIEGAVDDDELDKKNISLGKMRTAKFSTLPKNIKKEFLLTIHKIVRTEKSVLEGFFRRVGIQHFVRGNDIEQYVKWLQARQNKLEEIYSDELKESITQYEQVEATKLKDELTIENSFEHEQIYFYVPLAAKFMTTKNETHVDLLEFLKDFVVPGRKSLLSKKRLVMVQGDSGSGKTLSMLKLYQDLLELRKKDPEIPQPFFLRLSSLSPLVRKSGDYSFKYWVTKSLFENYDVRITPSSNILLLLDGYDEIERDFAKNLYFQCGLFAIKGVKVVITCRSQYLRDGYRDWFYPKCREGKFDKDLYEEVKLLPFSEKQIDVFLGKYSSEKKVKSVSEYRRQIDELPQVKEFISNPFLLRILVDALPELIRAKLEGETVVECTRYFIYECFMRQWFTKNAKRLLSESKEVDSKKVKSLVAVFDEFSWSLALLMHRENKVSFRSRESVELKDFLGEHDDARKGCPLKIIGDDEFAFIHNSFLEFFAARGIIKIFEMLEGTKEFGKFRSYRLLPKHLYFDRATSDFVDEKLNSGKSYLEMLDENGTTSKDLLYRWVINSREDRCGSSIWDISSFAISLLNFCNHPFSGIHFRGVSIRDADLRGGCFDGTSFSNCDLRGVDFGFCSLVNTSFFGCDMRNVKVSGEMDTIMCEEDVKGLLFHPFDKSQIMVGCWNSRWVYIFDVNTRKVENRFSIPENYEFHSFDASSNKIVMHNEEERILRFADVVGLVSGMNNDNHKHDNSEDCLNVKLPRVEVNLSKWTSLDGISGIGEVKIDPNSKFVVTAHRFKDNEFSKCLVVKYFSGIQREICKISEESFFEISPDGSHLFLLDDGAIHTFDVHRDFARVKFGYLEKIQGLYVNGLFTVQNYLVISFSTHVVVWKVGEEEIRMKIDLPITEDEDGIDLGTLDLFVSDPQHGRYMAKRHYCDIVLFEFDCDPSLKGILKGHEEKVDKIEFVESSLLISVATDDSLRIWNVRSLQCVFVKKLGLFSSFCIRGDKRLLSFCADKVVSFVDLEKVTETRVGFDSSPGVDFWCEKVYRYGNPVKTPLVNKKNVTRFILCGIYTFTSFDFHRFQFNELNDLQTREIRSSIIHDDVACSSSGIHFCEFSPTCSHFVVRKIVGDEELWKKTIKLEKEVSSESELEYFCVNSNETFCFVVAWEWSEHDSEFRSNIFCVDLSHEKCCAVSSNTIYQTTNIRNLYIKVEYDQNFMVSIDLNITLVSNKHH